MASARVPRYAVALVVLGGAIWVAAAALYSAEVVSCFSCGPVVVAPGIDTTGYPPGAIRTLAWDALYANLYVATVGLLAIAIGLTAFRRGERWALVRGQRLRPGGHPHRAPRRARLGRLVHVPVPRSGAAAGTDAFGTESLPRPIRCDRCATPIQRSKSMMPAFAVRPSLTASAFRPEGG